LDSLFDDNNEFSSSLLNICSTGIDVEVKGGKSSSLKIVCLTSINGRGKGGKFSSVKLNSF